MSVCVIFFLLCECLFLFLCICVCAGVHECILVVRMQVGGCACMLVSTCVPVWLHRRICVQCIYVSLNIFVVVYLCLCITVHLCLCPFWCMCVSLCLISFVCMWLHSCMLVYVYMHGCLSGTVVMSFWVCLYIVMRWEFYVFRIIHFIIKTLCV